MHPWSAYQLLMPLVSAQGARNEPEPRAGQAPMLALLAATLLFAQVPAFAATSLIEAAKANDSAGALALIKDKADVNATESDGTTPLHYAVYHDDVALVESLLKAGAKASVTNSYGSTPLSEAAVRGDVRVLQMLLKAGADPNAATRMARLRS